MRKEKRSKLLPLSYFQANSDTGQILYLAFFLGRQIMRYPNRRYGNPTEFQYYVATHGDGIKGVARTLRRDERTVRRWLNQTQKLPWWVPEILRLQRMESAEIVRQMTGHYPRVLAVVTDEAQLELRRAEPTKKPLALTDLRLDDFDLAVG
ncbi:hypothetical protein [Pseudoduganella sp. UC29_71]|uniref:hypothetical protein n=1 Tax=Pseudoduganella sp. UC29_71 TaxID=3350174 RepID=UPI00366B4FD6